MSQPIVSIQRIAKRYRLGATHKGAYGSLRDTITNVAKAPFRSRRRDGEPKGGGEYVWALKDVSFDVAQGELIGIVGRNGAGKSTLLKILSRITEPTEGRIRLRGRIASLLEVGTGFHPELTGRENVFLNGAILGMTRREIRRKFDEIVDFSGVERFLDTPVKRYSSGMRVRLGFAVAAHLEPEILLVDEVLAVGNAAFQKKCLGKMGDVTQQGRTVFFVSHNMLAIRNICRKTVWLHDGSVRQIGDTATVTDAYIRESLRAESVDDIPTIIGRLRPDPAVRLEAISVTQEGSACNVVLNNRPIDIEIKYTVLQRTTALRVYFDLFDDENSLLIQSFHDDDAEAAQTMEVGGYVSRAVIPADLLAPREYDLRVRIGIHNIRKCTGDGIGIILSVGSGGSINTGYGEEMVPSKLQPRIAWQTELRGGEDAAAQGT